MFLENKKVLITGGRGFLGGALAERLRATPSLTVYTPSSKEFDLRNQQDAAALFTTGWDVVFHCAGRVGGMFANMTKPADFMYDNLSMGLNVVAMAQATGVKKLINVGSSCMYPYECWTPYTPSELWTGEPHHANFGYGVAKRAITALCKAYRTQHRFLSVTCVLPNLYGPGDDFDPKSSHVIAGLVRRFVEAKEHGWEFVEIPGTGEARREFLYIDDAVDALISAAEAPDKGYDVLNMGSNKEYPISEVVDIIRFVVGYDGKVKFDAKFGNDGQRRKVMESGHDAAWTPKVSFVEGIKKTVESWTKSESLVNS